MKITKSCVSSWNNLQQIKTCNSSLFWQPVIILLKYRLTSTSLCILQARGYSQQQNTVHNSQHETNNSSHISKHETTNIYHIFKCVTAKISHIPQNKTAHISKLQRSQLSKQEKAYVCRPIIHPFLKIHLLIIQNIGMHQTDCDFDCD